MKKATKLITTVTVIGLMATGAVAADLIEDVAAKYNHGVKYTLNGEEVMAGKGALVYQDRVYVPIREISETLGVDIDYKDSTVIMTQDKELNYVKKTTDISFNDKNYTFSVSFPEYISNYVTLETSKDNNMCLIKFEKDGKTANIGSFTLFDEKTYDGMNKDEMPVPTEVLRKDGIVIGFMGVQDMVFEQGTEEANLVAKYHSDNANILKTVEFNLK